MLLRRALILSFLGGAVLLGGAADAPVIQAFRLIQPGAWTLHAVDQSEPDRRICIADPHDLIQLRHPGVGCSRFVLTNDPATAIVHYTCNGAGYGRTTIKVESAQLIRIELQGLANQSPYEVALEGRRTGACDAARGGGR